MAEPQENAGAVSTALAGQDPAVLREALLDNDLMVLYAESGAERSPQILTDPEGRRSVAAFSSQASLDAFTTSALVGVVPGSELAALALRQRVDTVLIDPAGPAPAVFEPSGLRDLIEGLEASGSGGGPVLRGEQAFMEPNETDELGSVRNAVRALVPADLPAYLVDRVTGEHRVLTLAVQGTSEQVRGVAESLDGVVRGDLDVLRLDDDAAQALAEQAPQCRVLRA